MATWKQHVLSSSLIIHIHWAITLGKHLNQWWARSMPRWFWSCHYVTCHKHHDRHLDVARYFTMDVSRAVGVRRRRRWCAHNCERCICSGYGLLRGLSFLASSYNKANFFFCNRSSVDNTHITTFGTMRPCYCAFSKGTDHRVLLEYPHLAWPTLFGKSWRNVGCPSRKTELAYPTLFYPWLQWISMLQ